MVYTFNRKNIMQNNFTTEFKMNLKITNCTK